MDKLLASHHIYICMYVCMYVYIYIYIYIYIYLGRNLPLFVGQKLLTETLKNLKGAWCNGKRCQVCQYLEKKCEFEDADGNKYDKYDIRKRATDCNTDFTVYKFHCSCCFKQYVRSNMIDFRYQFHSYKSVFRKVSKSSKLPKVIFARFTRTLSIYCFC